MLNVIKIGERDSQDTERLREVLAAALAGREYAVIEQPEDFGCWCSVPQAKRRGQAFLFAISLPQVGVSIPYARWLNAIMSHPGCLEGCVGAVVVDGHNEFFTKKRGRELIFVANAAGCSFPGKPLVEATGSLANFNILAQIQGLNNLAAYKKSVVDLVDKLLAFNPRPQFLGEKPHIFVVHASIRQTSNTLLLWNLVRQHLGERASVEEVSLRNGAVVDCRGCTYETCLHFGETGGCFYGGVMVHEVYPAIKRSDSLVLLCPNYNDAVSANLTAFINRLTALFRTDFTSFASKKIFALVVSGYSGGDIVAEQILDALNCNKNFILPGHFALIETANAPQSILKCRDIEKSAQAMAERLLAR